MASVKPPNHFVCLEKKGSFFQVCTSMYKAVCNRDSSHVVLLHIIMEM